MTMPYHKELLRSSVSLRFREFFVFRNKVKPANKSQEKKQKIEQVHCGGKRHNKKSGERRFFQKLSAFKVSSLRSSPIQAESKAS